MAKQQRAAVEPLKQEKQPVRMYVVYEGMLDERSIAKADWERLGVENAVDTTWNRDNNFQIPRDELPLDDEQLAEYLRRDRSLRLVER